MRRRLATAMAISGVLSAGIVMIWAREGGSVLHVFAIALSAIQLIISVIGTAKYPEGPWVVCAVTGVFQLMAVLMGLLTPGRQHDAAFGFALLMIIFTVTLVVREREIRSQ